jgi:hypothetical protein
MTAKVINLGDSGSNDLALLMHVAVQAARVSIETLGEELVQPDRMPGLEYPAFSTMHLSPNAWDGGLEDRTERMQQLTQAVHMLLAFGLAELLSLQQGYYIRCLPKIEDFMDYLK